MTMPRVLYVIGATMLVLAVAVGTKDPAATLAAAGAAILIGAFILSAKASINKDIR